MAQVEAEITIDISAAEKIEGWMSREELLWLATQASKIEGGMIVEIGTYLGRSARAIADNMGDRTHLICIDPYVSFSDPIIKIDSAEESRRLYRLAIKNLNDSPNADAINIRVSAKSVDAARNIVDGSLDMVFIDGEHTYESVKADIAAWRPKVKPGGLLCGHDYMIHSGVERAVGEAFEMFNHSVGSIWSVTL